LPLLVSKPEHGFTEVDGSRPGVWRFMEEVRDKGLDRGPESHCKSGKGLLYSRNA
jgi:hypothetical protein